MQDPSWLTSDLVQEVVFERELDAVIGGAESVGGVVEAPPLEFAPDHHVLDRVIEQVAERVLTDLEVSRVLAAARRDGEARVPGAARPLVAPRPVVERHEAEYRQELPQHRSSGIQEVALDADVDW